MLARVTALTVLCTNKIEKLGFIEIFVSHCKIYNHGK